MEVSEYSDHVRAITLQYASVTLGNVPVCGTGLI